MTGGPWTIPEPPRRILPEIPPRGHRALIAQLYELAGDIGTLRRYDGPEWILDTAGARVDVCLNLVLPSAAELVAAGVEVDEAVEICLARGERILRRLGEEEERVRRWRARMRGEEAGRP